MTDQQKLKELKPSKIILDRVNREMNDTSMMRLSNEEYQARRLELMFEEILNYLDEMEGK